MRIFTRKVYLRGLIEISNICRKNCLYCGIRCGNCTVQRYELSDEQILQEAQFALDAGYGSVVLQGGERTDSAYVERIARLVRQIKELRPSESAHAPAFNQPLGITLSLGEQSREVYKEWELHSREYKKTLEDGTFEFRLAHECVIKSFEVI